MVEVQDAKRARFGGVLSSAVLQGELTLAGVLYCSIMEDVKRARFGGASADAVQCCRGFGLFCRFLELKSASEEERRSRTVRGSLCI